MDYFYLGGTLPLLVSAWTDPSYYQRIYVQALFDIYASPLVSALGVGLLLFGWKRCPAAIRALAVAAILFFFLAGESAAWHDSYGATAVPALALGTGAAVDRLVPRVAPRWRLAVLALLLVTLPAYGAWRTRKWGYPAGLTQDYARARRSCRGCSRRVRPLLWSPMELPSS